MMPDGSCMAGKEHPGPAKASATSKASATAKAPAKEKAPVKPKTLKLGKSK